MIGDKESSGDLVLGHPVIFPVSLQPPEFSIATGGDSGSWAWRDMARWSPKEFISSREKIPGFCRYCTLCLERFPSILSWLASVHSSDFKLWTTSSWKPYPTPTTVHSPTSKKRSEASLLPQPLPPLASTIPL